MATRSPKDVNAENQRLSSENEELRLRLQEAEQALRAIRTGQAEYIAERKQAEEALREANLQLAEADRRKNEFLGLLSHELRNPLTPIRNGIYILEKATPGGPQARRALAVIDRQVSHLTQLVDDLLDVTRISRGKIRLQRARLDLVEIVRRTVEDHRAFLEHHEVVLELPSDVIPIDGDPTRLGQVIGNRTAPCWRSLTQGWASTRTC
jgi:signal transduction histidine kinase